MSAARKTSPIDKSIVSAITGGAAPVDKTPRGLWGDRPGRRGGVGLEYSVCRSLGDVISAWQLVHFSYVRSGLIDANPYEIHTMAAAVSPRTMVVLARLGDLPVATISAILDGEGGLPSDCVFRGELDEMRKAGRKVMELGLFADRREHIGRSFGALLELMRFTFFYGAANNVSDAIITVVPRHGRFYSNYFAFDPAAGPAPHPVVREHEVEMLRLDAQGKLASHAWPAGFQYFFDHPIAPETFQARCMFNPAEIEGSAIGRFLRRNPPAAPIPTVA